MSVPTQIMMQVRNVAAAVPAGPGHELAMRAADKLNSCDWTGFSDSMMAAAASYDANLRKVINENKAWIESTAPLGAIGFAYYFMEGAFETHEALSVIMHRQF